MSIKKSGNAKTDNAGGSFGAAEKAIPSNLELLNEIDQMLEAETEDALDTEKLERYLALLQDRAPVVEDFDPRQTLAELEKDYPALFTARRDDAASRRKPARFARVAEIVVAAVLILTVSAKAFGHDPFETVYRWTKDVIQIYRGPSGTTELSEPTDGGYSSLKEALVKNGEDSSIYPAWVPEDYTLVKVLVTGSELSKGYSAVYDSARGEVLVNITRCNGSSGYVEYVEKDAGGKTYSKNGVTYYLITNNGDSSAGWQTGKYSCAINGKLSEDELKQMIDSIGE